MYIDSLRLENIRTFVDERIEFMHPDRPETFGDGDDNGKSPRPRLPNVTVLLGDNAAGKSTVLQALALSALGPAVREAGIGGGLLRRNPQTFEPAIRGEIRAEFVLHAAEVAPEKAGRKAAVSSLILRRIGELEPIEHAASADAGLWNSVYASDNAAFFLAAYGAARRTEPGENFDKGARLKARFLRAQRMQSLFDDTFTLVPPTFWLPGLRESRPARHAEIVDLLRRLVQPAGLDTAGEFSPSEGDILFVCRDVPTPLRELSDGYRAFVGWAADLLNHLHSCIPGEGSLRDVRGTVLIDEIELHLHPRRQMSVLRTLSETFPRLQFVCSTHSPLIAAGVEWMNLVHLRSDGRNSTKAERSPRASLGLNADQMLVSEYFGLESTRSPAKSRQLDDLTPKARSGDEDAARELVRQLALGTDSAP